MTQRPALAELDNRSPESAVENVLKQLDRNHESGRGLCGFVS
jgi:hypothetical protein